MNEKEYLVVGRTNATNKFGGQYCTLKLKNLTEELTIAVWDVKTSDEPVVGQIVSFFNIQDNDGKKAARKLDMHPGAIVQEGHPLYPLLPHPIKQTDWNQCINNLLAHCTDDKLKNLITEFSQKLYAPYSQYPAATSVHHAFKGGLLNHTYQMLHMLEGLYPVLPYKVKLERCVIAILFHDYGKVYEYSKDGNIQPPMYLLGHIYISTNRLQKELEKQAVDNDEITRILHIVLAHHGQLEFGSPVMPCTQEAVLVTHLDNLSAKMDNIDSTPNMERSFALSTHVIKD